MHHVPAGGSLTQVRRRFWTWCLVMLALDQATKVAVRLGIGRREQVPLLPDLLSLVHVENDAAAFGSMDDVPGRRWLFLALTAVGLAGIGALLVWLPPTAGRMGTALGVLVGGVLGNAVDRLLRGSVTDWVHVFSRHPDVVATVGPWLGTSPTAPQVAWPAFNVADAAIPLGFVLVVAAMLWSDDDDPLAAAPGDATTPPSPP